MATTDARAHMVAALRSTDSYPVRCQLVDAIGNLDAGGTPLDFQRILNTHSTLRLERSERKQSAVGRLFAATSAAWEAFSATLAGKPCNLATIADAPTVLEAYNG